MEGGAAVDDPSGAGALESVADMLPPDSDDPTVVPLGTGPPVAEASVFAAVELGAAVLAGARPVPTTVEIGVPSVVSFPSSTMLPEGAASGMDKVWSLTVAAVPPAVMVWVSTTRLVGFP